MTATDSKLFFWGCGHPTQYGLYSPVIRRFVLVDHRVEILEYVMLLLSSKIRLIIVRLDSAPNFEINLIDNSCCTCWGVTDWPDYALDQEFMVPRTEQGYLNESCGTLVELPDKNIVEVQQFAMLAAHVVSTLKFHRNVFYSKLNDLIDLPFDDYTLIKDIEKECYRMIYYSDSYQDIEDTVIKMCTDADIAVNKV